MTGARQASSEAATLGLAGRRVVVVGLGASGLAATRVLRDAGALVRVSEARPLEDLHAIASEAEAMGAEVLAGGHAPEHLADGDLVVVSPGVPEGAPVLGWARERDVPVWTELDLGAKLAACPYVAVTGTNGKTTTTEMVAAAMRGAGLDAVACGNAGHPFSLAAREGRDALAVEVSSFQLRFHHALRPRVSVLLNLAPDHLDWHGGFGGYREAKRRVFELQGGDDVHVGNRDDPEAAAVSAAAPCAVVWFGLGPPDEGAVGWADGELRARLGAEPTSLGRPAAATPALRSNAAAAAAAGLSFGLPASAVAEALSAFEPLPHRGAVVAEVEGVRFVDDSKATNPHAAVRSIAGWPEVVLVAGGRSKGVDLTPLLQEADRLRGVVVLGEAAEKLAALFEGRTAVARATTIEEATGIAFAMASGRGTVLLAPACASQDMFRDYAERGERFAAAAGRLGEGR